MRNTELPCRMPYRAFRTAAALRCLLCVLIIHWVFEKTRIESIDHSDLEGFNDLSFTAQPGLPRLRTFFSLRLLIVFLSSCLLFM